MPDTGRFRSPPHQPSAHPASILLVGGEGDTERLLAACTRRDLRLPLEFVPDEGAALQLLSRRGDFLRREQAPALLLLSRPELASALPLLEGLRQLPLLRHLPALLLTPDGLPCAALDAAGLAPLLYFQRPRAAADYERLAEQLAALLPEF